MTISRADEAVSARQLLELAEAHIEALEQYLAAPHHLRHQELVLPMLHADLRLWERVRALSRQHLAVDDHAEPP